MSRNSVGLKYRVEDAREVQQFLKDLVIFFPLDSDLSNKTGINKGNLNHEEFFQMLEELQNRYNDVFIYNDFALNPTAWNQTVNGWERIVGY